MQRSNVASPNRSRKCIKIKLCDDALAEIDLKQWNKRTEEEWKPHGDSVGQLKTRTEN